MQDFDPVGLVQHLQFLRLVQLSTTFATIYDHLIVFDQEVVLIWQRPGISAKIFFLLTRYCGDDFVITMLIFLTEATSDNVSFSCHNRILLQIWAAAIPAWIVQFIMWFRVYALYNRAKWVLALTFTCLIIQIAISMVLFALYQDVRVIAVKFDIWTTCVVTEMPAYSIGTWLSMMVFEGTLFALVLYKTVVHLLWFNYPWTRNGATEVLLRDNILHFLVIFSIYCFKVIAWFALPIIWVEVLSSLNVTATCTLGCRLLLNIRDASYRHEECVNTEEIDFQMRELVDGLHRGALASGGDPTDSSVCRRCDDEGD
ncbi:hypothetical protein JAAARDRAFT_36849 [Jaapia argillacea MUCL 33604]|uniref:DUF6533 domain-containing protein n=1 Tax=Jaapia argillacea MUCL 33604 TaxID=933084 RepID=A0A067PMM7_9AGAM|nr:hypothetical protein JAAARDRAFT_36849 [Jaapia argillacea MUCL 33604]